MPILPGMAKRLIISNIPISRSAGSALCGHILCTAVYIEVGCSGIWRKKIPGNWDFRVQDLFKNALLEKQKFLDLIFFHVPPLHPSAMSEETSMSATIKIAITPHVLAQAFVDVCKMSRGQLSQKLKVSESSIGRVFSNSISPASKHTKKILRYLQMKSPAAAKKALAAATKKRFLEYDKGLIRSREEFRSYLRANPHLTTRELTQGPGRLVLSHIYKGRVSAARKDAGLAPLTPPGLRGRSPQDSKKEMISFLKRNPGASALDLYKAGHQTSLLKVFGYRKISKARLSAGLAANSHTVYKREQESKRKLPELKAYLKENPSATLKDIRRAGLSSALSLLDLDQFRKRQIPKGWILASQRAREVGCSRQLMSFWIRREWIPCIRLGRQTYVAPESKPNSGRR